MIDQKNGIPTIVKKHGNAISRSAQSISLSDELIIIPTIISTHEVAASGTSPVAGVRKSESAKQIPVTVEVSPVLPPAAIPEVDSTKVVTVEVPKIAPIDVAKASASMAFSILGKFPFSSSKPALSAAPMRVPIVSNISTSTRVMITASSEAIGAENSSPKPVKHFPNIEKSICGAQLSGTLIPISMPKQN